MHDTFKVAPAIAPGTVGWNSTMSLNDIFDQLMTTYGKPTPDAMRQNNTIHRSLNKSSSNAAWIAKKLQSLRRYPTHWSNYS